MSEGPREDPHVTRSKAHVLAAAVEVLLEEGAVGLTIEKVAARSGVARTTIYRHWPDRGDLLFSALESLGDKPPLARTDDLVADLRVALRDLAAALRRSTWASLMPTIIDESERDPAFATLARAFGVGRRAPLRRRLDEAVADGRLPDGIDTDLLAAQLVGPLFYRRFVSRQPVTGRVVDQVVGTLIGPLLR